MSIASVTLPVGRSAFVAEQLWSLGILAALCLLLALLRQLAKTQNWQYKHFKEKNAVTPRGARRGGNLNPEQKQFVKWSRTHWTSVFVGTDGRLSTSKTMAILWTFALAYMLLVMGLIAAAATEPGNTLSALISATSGLYLVLIGGPFAAAVLAKATVSTGTATGRLQKSYSASTNLTDIIANDQGNTDLVDSQYTLFNLIALAIVLVAFVRKPGFGAPDIPGFLAGLTGASAATYAANKAAISNAPVISQVIPALARIGQRVTAHGTNLHAAAGDDATTTVTVGGFQATVAAQDVQADHVTFTIPPPTAGTYPSDRPVGVAITTVAGATAVKPDGITVLEDKITVTRRAAENRPAKIRPHDLRLRTIRRVGTDACRNPGERDQRPHDHPFRAGHCGMFLPQRRPVPHGWRLPRHRDSSRRHSSGELQPRSATQRADRPRTGRTRDPYRGPRPTSRPGLTTALAERLLQLQRLLADGGIARDGWAPASIVYGE